VFKGFDTALSHTQNVFHSAFEDTRQNGHANARVSVEARYIALWE
jgi:hypothetical protein